LFIISFLPIFPKTIFCRNISLAFDLFTPATVTSLLETTDNWTFNIYRGFVNAVFFLDLKKAFGTVNHPILLSKLYLYGVKGNAYELLSSYLDNRREKCAVNGLGQW